MPQDFFGIEKELTTPLGKRKYYSLQQLAEKRPEVKSLPYSIRILLENAIRNYDDFAVKEEHLETLLNWKKTAGKNKSKSKIGTNNATSSSITNDTYDHQTPITPSIIHATHQTDPNYLILKGLEVFKAMHPSRYH